MTFAEYVDAYLTVKSRSGSEWSVLCPVHNDHNASMRINVDRGVFFCHGCHVKGGMAKLGRLVGVRFQTNSSDMAMGLLLERLSVLTRGDAGTPSVYLDESYLDQFKFPTSYWTDPLPIGRSFTEETVEAFGLGYDILNDAVTIPVRDIDGQLIGVTRRYMDDDADKRYRDPKGFQKRLHLFGSWFAVQHPSPTIVLVEGPLDAIKVWQAGHVAVAQFGSHLTFEQIKLLRQMGTLRVVLFYDNDKGGKLATSEALGLIESQKKGKWEYDPAHDLRKFFVVSQAKYPRGAKDPGGMRDADIDLCVTSARYLR